MITFTTQSMQEIFPQLTTLLQQKNRISFHILNPDIAQKYAGEYITIDGKVYCYRGYKSWTDLAELLQCKILTPQEKEYPLVKLTFQKLEEDSFHSEEKSEEKYGSDSAFARIHKMEEPAFFYYYNQALYNVRIEDKKRILNLGINRGDEFEVIKNKLEAKTYENIECIGVDHSKSTITQARQKFPERNCHFYTEDINDIDTLALGKFDLLISIGTLQSPSINFKPFFMKLVQEYLLHDSAIILGFPNSRWRDAEVIYGAKVPNYTMSELGHLFSDVMFCKKYLQQKNYRVTLTGKYYIFLTATKICY